LFARRISGRRPTPAGSTRNIVEVLLLPMLDNTITVARADGAGIVLPGTVYNFGPDAFPDLHDIAAESCHRQGLDSRRDGAEVARGSIDGARCCRR
jgi:hypothetical protein